MAEDTLAGEGSSDDPTRNVLDLVQAAIQRQDDLRACESRHVREIAALRAEYASELRSAESARIDAIRAVDVGAVNRAAEVAATQAAALASQVAAAAEAMRTQVAATATASTVALAAALEPVQRDVQDLRKAQYEAAGQKTQIVETRSRADSSTLWIGLAVAVAAVAVTFLLGVAGVVVTLLLSSS